MPTPYTHIPLEKWISPAQVALVLSKTKNIRDKAVLAVTYQLGLRRSEVGLLKRHDYDGSFIDRGRAKVKLWEQTKKFLDTYLASRTDTKDHLFLNRIGNKISSQTVYYVYHNAATQADLPVRHRHPHTLKHSISFHLAQSLYDIPN